MVVGDYLLDFRDLDLPALFAEWAWIVPPRFTVWLMNRFGDAFIVREDGSVHMLDIGAGTFTRVTDNRDDFLEKVDEADNADQWLLISVVDRLVDAGVVLLPGQCYSCRLPPVLGGTYDVENVLILPIAEHFGVNGEIHRQLRDLPDGTWVEITTT